MLDGSETCNKDRLLCLRVRAYVVTTYQLRCHRRKREVTKDEDVERKKRERERKRQMSDAGNEKKIIYRYVH